MAYTTVIPPPPLSPAVEAIWDWHVEPGALRFERILPQPGSGLIVNLREDETRVYADDAGVVCERSPGAVYSGQFTQSFVIDSSEQIAVVGILFRPGGARAFLRERMDLFGNRHCAVDDLVGHASRGLRERLLHAADAQGRLALVARWLLDRHVAAPLHPAVAQALQQFRDRPVIASIAEIVADSGLSARRFGTLFREQVGVAPKPFARLLRFRSIVAVTQRRASVDWTRVATDCGFHDQPHLNREFRAFAGMTPGAYLAQRGGYSNHVAVGDAR